MARTQEQGKRKNLILRLCIFAFVAYAALLLVDMQVTLSERRRELDVLQIQFEEQRLANKELELRLRQGVDEGYIERVAREKLDYVAPGERVFVDVSGN